MGYIIYGNILDSTVTTAVTVSSGSIVDVTDSDKLLTRALADKYQYTKSGLGQITITLTLAQDESTNSLSILGNNNTGIVVQSITLKNGGVDQGNDTPDPIFKSRYVDGEYILDEHFIFNAYYTFDSIEIKYSDVSGDDGCLSKILSGVAVEFDFKPSNLIYTPVDTSQKDYSNGRQAYVRTGVMYNNVKATAVALTQSKAWNAGGVSVNDINLIAGLDQPLIFIPSNTQNISVYGTQKTLAVLTPMLKKDSDDWYWNAVFNIEEEL